ncbi:hypothetical protein B7494_g5450 [Chlorociboria aeruginascens]|nr:hypothetical protein B7494_g5450 [Chlorociboria aeruginascens]
MAVERSTIPSAKAISRTRVDEGIKTLRYEDTVESKPPIPIVLPPPLGSDVHPALRSLAEDRERDNSKRDSGLAPTTSSKAREDSVNIGDDSAFGVTINFNSRPQPSSVPQSPTTSQPPETPKLAKSESVGSGSRGSIMFGGKKAMNTQGRLNGAPRQPSISLMASPTIKILSDDLERESQKVRSMYESGSTLDWRDGKNSPLGDNGNIVEEEEPAVETTNEHLTPIPSGISNRPESVLSTRSHSLPKKEHELAGGIEDWEDIDGKDVDRYGFIKMQGKPSRPGTPEPRPPQRVSTILQVVSEMPRKRRTLGRSPSSATSRKGLRRSPNGKVSARSLRTQSSSVSQRSTSRSQMRAAANRLPGNRDRRWMDEAGDMLTLPPGLADIVEDEEAGKVTEGQKKKEWDRAEKWRKMAKVVKVGKDGEGMEFEFDTTNSKLVERTWKGIPDRWRSAAWYSFLSAAAKKKTGSATDKEIIDAFYKLLDQSSADDYQIDMDVPRTINSHIMFRTRYRGGQRLLFRVLHTLSLYFPDTGYVQGMASLAATLLCYFDEEKAFVMLVRMWTLRGLDKLYEADFPGLMAALDEFQKQWLDGSDIAAKLVSKFFSLGIELRPTQSQVELNIEPTAYGTRWYLTLFNYSIPFAAQLRVWDIFMLLGDADPSSPPTAERPFSYGLDVLHATSAALIAGTREILLDSDFENAMKVLTSWIPVKDEELLMKVTKAEWKLHRKGKKH